MKYKALILIALLMLTSTTTFAATFADIPNVDAPQFVEHGRYYEEFYDDRYDNDRYGDDRYDDYEDEDNDYDDGDNREDHYRYRR